MRRSIKRRLAPRTERHTHGETIRQLWADSAEAFVPPAAAKAGLSRVPERLRVEKPDPVILVPSTQTLDYGGKRADVRAAARQARRDRRRSL